MRGSLTLRSTTERYHNMGDKVCGEAVNLNLSYTLISVQDVIFPGFRKKFEQTVFMTILPQHWNQKNCESKFKKKKKYF